MGPCVVAQVPNQEPLRLWNRAAGGWFRITLVSFLASLPVEQLRAFPSSLSDCQTPTGWNCSGENLPHSKTRHTFTFVCVPRLDARSRSTSKFKGPLPQIAAIVHACACCFGVSAVGAPASGAQEVEAVAFCNSCVRVGLGNASAMRLPQRLIASLTQKHLG